MENSNDRSRRDFLKRASLLGAAIATPAALSALPVQATGDGGDNFTFLFQGDSITDGNRSRNTDWNHVMGHGYACLIASRLWFDLPDKKFHFFNRGVSGNTVPDLTKRWNEDTIALSPNVLSILVGINDLNATINGNKAFTMESYENDYRSLLIQTRQQMPNVQFVICEPFILPVGKVKEKWNLYQLEIITRQSSAKKLAQQFDAIYVPLQDAFNEALKRAPAEYWIWDGIHPMPAGHELIAREWIKVVGKKLRFIRS